MITRDGIAPGTRAGAFLQPCLSAGRFVLLVLAIAVAHAGPASAAATTFTFTGGAQTFVVPTASAARIETWGAQGGHDPGKNPATWAGQGAYVSSVVGVTPGETLQVMVGGMGGNATYPDAYEAGGAGGFNGGGRGGSRPAVSGDTYGMPGGGGASDVRQGGSALGNRIVVAGGGGGGAVHANFCSTWATSGLGGRGGAPNGGAGAGAARFSSGQDAVGGGGATQSTGGAAAASYWSTSWPATAGSLGQGGVGSSFNTSSYNPGQGAGGGGGYFGGGGGGNSYECGGPGGGGGGGSSYAIGSSVQMTAGAWGGNGQVVITPAIPGSPASLGQFRSDGTTAMASGSYQPTSTVVLRFTVSDSVGGRSVVPWVEIRPNGASFSGTCGSAVGGVVIAGSAVSTPAQDTQYQASVTVSGLSSGSSYRWRACATDGVATSPWVAHGGSPDFIVDTAAPTAPTFVTPTAGATVGTTPTLTATYRDPATGSSGILSFQVCSDTGCSSVVASGSSGAGIAPDANGSWTVSPALASGTYYWRAFGTDSAGNVGVASTPQQMRVVVLPTLGSASPSSLPQARRGLVVRLTGTGFQAAPAVTISGTGVTITAISFVSASAIDVTVDVASSASAGARNVTVTNGDGGSVTSSGLVSVVVPSITIGISTLGYADGARGTTTIGFGTLTPGTVREIGTTGSGQAIAGPALRVAITSDTHTQLSLRQTVAATGGGSTIAAASFGYRASGATGAWTPFSTSDVVAASMLAPGTAQDVDFDLQLSVPAAQAPGTYSATTTVTVVPNP